jgi:hypothetical protein
MIDVSSFLAERERLRSFCFRRTRAAIVIRDTCHSGLAQQRGFADPQNDRVSRLAELLQFLLMVNAKRFADPDDTCPDFGPSIFALPTIDAQQDVATIMAASDNTFEAIIVDYRLSEAVLPVLAPHLVFDKSQAVRTWNRALRKQGRIAAILTIDPETDDAAILCDGGPMLRRNDGESFDLAGSFWLGVFNEIGQQRCMRRETWRQKDFQTEGNA